MPQHRILHVNSSGSIGGGEKYLLTLAREMPQYQTHFVVPEPGAFAQTARQLGYAVEVIRLSPWPNPLAVLALRRYIRSHAIQLVHTHGARANFYGRLAARLAGVRIILSTVHNS